MAAIAQRVACVPAWVWWSVASSVAAVFYTTVPGSSLLGVLHPIALALATWDASIAASPLVSGVQHSAGQQPVGACQLALRTASIAGLTTLGLAAGLHGTANFSEDYIVVGPVAVLGATLAVTSAVVAAAVLPSVLYVRRFPEARVAPLALSVAFSSTWVVVGTVSPLGTLAHPALVMWGVPDIAQLVALGGLALVAVVLTIPASLALHAQARPKRASRHAFWCCGVYAVVSLVGSTRRLALEGGYFPLDGLASTPTPVASCIANADRWRASQMLQHTRTRLAVGDALVVWSEGAAYFAEPAGEAWLLQALRTLLAPSPPPLDHSRSASVVDQYVMAAYAVLDGDGVRRNRASLVRVGNDTHPGEVLASYDKRHLVPVGESSTRAGTTPPPVVRTTLGAVSPLICFDADAFAWGPTFAAGQAPTLVLQPARTWGSIGALHARNSALRALEEGVMWVRCAAWGVSAVVLPSGTVALWHTTGDGDILPFPLRLPTTHAPTSAPTLRALLAAVLLLMHAVIMLLACLPVRMLVRVLAPNGRSLPGALTERGQPEPGPTPALRTHQEEGSQRVGPQDATEGLELHSDDRAGSVLVRCSAPCRLLFYTSFIAGSPQHTADVLAQLGAGALRGAREGYAVVHPEG